MSSASARADSRLRVVLFSGGRGSRVLSKQLISNPDIALTVAINGYDDGASTGEVRRFLGDALGPSDFRKNASRLASELKTCSAALVALLDRRLPADSNATTLSSLIATLRQADPVDAGVATLAVETRTRVAACLGRFAAELATGRPFNFDDCSVGNLVFAGGYLLADRHFNRAVDDYAALVGLSPGLIENVTDGANAHLVALDVDGRVLAREADIVDATRQNRIRDIYLLSSSLAPAEVDSLQRLGGDGAAAALDARSMRPRLNSRLAEAIARADMLVYAPGTQHSSLFPSYLTEGL